MIGQEVLHYNILDKLGEGGMGVVYKARDTRLERMVAIKFLPRQVAAGKEERDRFRIEAKAAGALAHPNIATIHAIEEVGDELFIVMEYIEGSELRDLVEVQNVEPQPIEKTLDYAIQIAEGLEAAHERGVVHRDIKSANIMITKKGHAKIMDFGLAKMVGGAQMTAIGIAVGTAAYMSPEQTRGEQVDHKTDIWSFGVVLYEMLTGQRPFKGDYMDATIYAILHEEPESISSLCPELPKELDRIVHLALTKNVKERYQHVSDMLYDLRSLKEGAEPGVPDNRARRKLPFLIEDKDTVEVGLPLCVGREQEFSKLESFLESVLAGKGKVIFVTGEAGSGKTTLIKAFEAHAQKRHSDLIAVSGKCNAHVGIGDPYMPFREVLSLLTGDVEALWNAGAINREHATRLWNLLPHAVQALDSVGQDLIGTFLAGEALVARAQSFSSGHPDWLVQLKKLVDNKVTVPASVNLQQVQLFDRFTKVVQSLARRQPLLIVLDDLQWADAGSISLLFHLGRNIDGSRILIVGSYRPTEIVLRQSGERHPLEAVVNEFKQHFGDPSVELNQTDGRHFVDVFLDMESNRLDTSFRETLFRQTEGHALFTVELLRSMQEQGLLVHDADGQWVEGSALNWETLPARVDAIVGERIGRLPEHLKQVLTLASPQGETFTAEVVAKQMNIEPRDIIQLLSTDLDKKHNLVRAQGIQRINGERLSQYRFRHALFQRYLYNTLDKVERTYLHEEVGLILEDFYGEQTNEISVQLARHFRKAGIVDKALNYLMQAATHSKQVFANEAALEHFQTALILIDKAFAGDKKSDRFRHLKADILEGLGDVQAILGHHDDARSSFQNGLTQIANDDIMSQSRLRRKTGKTFEVQRRFDEALKTLESAEAILGEPGEKTVDWWYEWIEVQTERIWHHYWLGQLEKMTELANNAEPAVEQYGNPAQRATFYNGLTLLAYRRDRYVISDETVSHSRTALSASEESENMNSIGMSRFLLGFTLLWRRDLEEAEEQLLEGLKVVEATGDIVLQSRCLTYLTVVYRKRGEVEKVRQYVPKCLAAAKSGQMIEYVATANANTAWLAWNDGNLSEAEGKGQEALETWQRVLVGHASCAMQWLAAWPLISVALAKDQIPDALDLAGILLQETQQRMPDRLTAILEESLEIWDTGNVEKTRAKLEQAEAEAKRMSYL